MDFSETVLELCRQYPEVKDILAEVGFKEIALPGALEMMGRVMTIPKGAALKGIGLSEVMAAFEAHGFVVVNGQPGSDAETPQEASTPEERSQLLQSYIRRLTAGEDLKTVQADFVKHFRGVDAEEIASAEQQLIRSGMPIGEVQRMCDVHSALFHGSTVSEDLFRKGIDSQTMRLVKEEGHPLNILYQEDVAIDGLMNEVQTLLAEGVQPMMMQRQLRGLQTLTDHFAKKGNLLYPLLRNRYDVDAPYNVMWGVDDEIRNQLHRLCKQPVDDEDWREKMKEVLKREQEMIYKEVNILFPLCADHFSEDDWQEVRTEIDGFRPAVIGGYPEWPRHRHTHPLYRAEETTAEVRLPSGHLTPGQLTAMLDTMPYEVTFVDDRNINRYFNQQREEKLFKRPLMALDRPVFDCHPPRVQPVVRKLLEDFRNGHRDSFEVWSEKGGHDVLIRYMAVRDEAGKFLGTLECVQVMDFARKHYAAVNATHGNETH